MQKSNKNEILTARVKNSNCLNFCTQVDPSKTRKAVLLGCLEAFSHAKKQCALFRSKKMSVKKTSLFIMCHYSEFHKITSVNCRRNDLQDDVKFSLGKCFLATQETRFLLKSETIN